MSASPVDPITLEVLRETFSSIVREMRVTLVRTAYSSILYEGEDFSCVLMDGDAQLVAMSKGQDHPLHIVPISWSMKSVKEKFGDDIHPGDIFLHNDPYTGGTHLNDVAMIYPLFADGRLFVFPVVRAHWGDVGGMSPGSLSGDATEIFQEGVRIPPIRIVDRGTPNQAALDLIFHNMRGPRERKGDFDAMIGTCRKAAERVEALAARYGAAVVRAAVVELMDRAEQRMRRAIGALPDGHYSYEAHLESGRERLEPLTIRARVTVAGETITVDLTGTSPQAAAPTNVGPAMAPTGAFTDHQVVPRSRHRRELGRLPPAHRHHPARDHRQRESPRAVRRHGRGEVLRGDRGDGRAGPGPRRPGGRRSQGRRQSLLRGRARSADRRDLHLLRVPGGRHRRLPRRRRQQYRPHVDRERHDHAAAHRGGGAALPRSHRADFTARRLGRAGQWRGGLGLTREVRILVPASRLSVLAEKAVLPPFGVCGGGSGATNRFWVRRGEAPIQPSPLPGKVGGFPLRAGRRAPDGELGRRRLRRPAHARSGRGGRGHRRRLRDPGGRGAGLRGDLARRRGRCRRDGGDPRGATRGARPRALRPGGRSRRRRGAALLRLDAQTAARLGVGPGAIVELVNPGGAPLRAWVDSLMPGNGQRGEIAPSALAMLGWPRTAS